MIDPLVSLAFAMHSRKGVYAVLLGSGVSRSAGIPTGWEVVLDLIRKLAHVQGESSEPDPVAWYQAKYGREPDYSKLLDALAKTAAERNQLLKAYFEPTEDEREQGRKKPTPAHNAIAGLVASGHVRVIVTTNFDHLMENALRAAGVVPTIISTPDAAEGATPLTHAECTVVKVHGDYLDNRIKNTPAELAKYDRRINKLLNRIFDEFGLIICGWSGDWDTALRAAIERCHSHRYTTVWASRGEPGGTAKKLIDLRNAEVVPIQGADAFFQDLADKVAALEELDRPHPLSVQVAVASVKRYVSEEKHRIQLHDLVMQEVERVATLLSSSHLPPRSVNAEELKQWAQRQEALSEILLGMTVAGCYWCDTNQEKLWASCVQRIANSQIDPVGRLNRPNPRLYAALRLLYGGGIAAVAAGHFRLMYALMFNVALQDCAEEYLAVDVLHTWGVLNQDAGRLLTGQKYYAPLSEHLYGTLRTPLREYLPDDRQYEKFFDRFEYLRALIGVDSDLKKGGRGFGPIGRFGYEFRRDSNVVKDIRREASQAGARWEPLKAGFFEGSYDSLQQVMNVFDSQLERLDWS
jgi:NAD-dependent SIR2 family protein deacetylase